jgi:hypothetical protein
MTIAQHHYQACISAWAKHLLGCDQCQRAVETKQHTHCEVGRACLCELLIAGERMASEFITDTSRAA